MTKRATITEADVRRIVAGAQKAGYGPFVIEYTREGDLRLVPASEAQPSEPGPQPENW